MKKCKNCQVNDARYICLGCSREFCTYCMKEDEFLCSQCRYNKQHENQKQQRQQENKSKLKKNNHRIINIIYIIIASSILFLGIILVLTSYPSLINMISSNGTISEEEQYNNNRDGFIYIFPFPFAIPLEFNSLFIIPLILTFIIITPIILLLIFLKLIKIS
ncbi:MAG TPA: hypothetical protein VJ767_04065 [Nitrososphaeraceae archaeon]|nr:hypothetical protein [Nitrososphaeraceae archaeon]